MTLYELPAFSYGGNVAYALRRDKRVDLAETPIVQAHNPFHSATLHVKHNTCTFAWSTRQDLAYEVGRAVHDQLGGDCGTPPPTPTLSQIIMPSAVVVVTG